MDRTNWQWGKANINILTLGIAFKGIAIPIYWTLLDKKGNSDTQERIALIQKFIHSFGKQCIAGLLADREFIGTEWFGWLLTEQIPFWIRVKDNLCTTNSRGRPIKIKDLFRDLPLHHERALYGKRSILGHDLYVAGLRLPDNDYLIIVTPDYPGLAISKYSWRWEIESAPQTHKVTREGCFVKCCKAIGKMVVGPPKSAVRSRLQTTPSGCH